jgi:hypothetical protein
MGMFLYKWTRDQGENWVINLKTAAINYFRRNGLKNTFGKNYSNEHFMSRDHEQGGR